MRGEKWEGRGGDSHRERGVGGPDYTGRETETDRHNQGQSEGLVFAEKQRPEKNEREEDRKRKEGRKGKERLRKGNVQRNVQRKSGKETKAVRGASSAELAAPPAPALLLAWQPGGCARERAPGGGGAQAGEPNVFVMCLSPNQFISYKQHDIRS